jgi:methylated-DNA-protein-cysteine methyltransferase-like protein
VRSPYEKIYAVIARIPPGRVATYGQVAALAGLPGHARQVGTALGCLPEGSPVPWQRVVNARGEVSPRGGLGIAEGFQRHLLEEEEVGFDERGRIDLERFGWDPLASLPRKARRRSSLI